MARPTQALGRRSKLFLVEETTALTLKAHAAGDAIRTLGAKLSSPRMRELHADSDKSVAAAAHSPTGIETQLGFSAYVRPSGSVGGAAELDPVLKGALGASSTPGATTEDGGSSTTTQLDVADASAYTAGDILWLVTTGEAVLIESISTNAITPAAPLSTAPTSGETVNSGKQFSPADDLPTFSAYLDDDHLQRAAAGIVLNGLTLTWDPSGLVKVNVDAPGCGKMSSAGTAALEGVHALGAGTLTLEAGQGLLFDITGGDMKVTVDPGGANEETHTVTAVTGDALTLSGTLAAEQADATEVSFYSVTPTHTGDPVSGIHGAAIFEINDGTTQTRFALPLRACELKVTNGYVWSRDYGNEHRNVFERESENPREVVWSATVRLTQEATKLLKLARTDITGSILVWGGTTAGKIIAGGSRKVQWNVPDIESAPSGLSTLKIDGRALESSDGEADEARLAAL